MDKVLKKKYNSLLEYLKNLNATAVAYSAGVDSTLLLYVAKEALDDKAIALSANAPIVPKREIEEAELFCKSHNIKHIIFEFNIDKFSHNPKERCYICKYEIFTNIKNIAKQNNIENIIEGSNLDDDSDFRPGRKALLELNILSPFCTCGFTKEDIRNLSKELNLYTYNKASFACLASRIPYGDKITKEKLNMIELAEDYLMNELKFSQFRVRLHNNIARIEVLEDDFEKIIKKDVRDKINSKFKSLGFDYITLDLSGYRRGSLNEVLTDN